jgi:16S rRNA (adenine1518-N6/adenine1519-N6)-dimethyltransferase
LFDAEGLRPQKQYGQCFLIDRNLMDRLVATADLSGTETVLEVGPATGSLTEELLPRAKRVVACEIDRRLGEVLTQRLGGSENLTVIVGDVLAGKHEMAGEVLETLGPEAHLVSNLPYNIATPLISLCLQSSWRAMREPGSACRFDRLSFTVQKEVADRLAAAPGCGEYGPISVLISLLGSISPGPIVPATAFWPKPKIASRIVRIDFDPAAAKRIDDLPRLIEIVAAAFGHRRKQLGTIFRKGTQCISGERLTAAMESVGIDPSARCETIPPEQFATLARATGD